MKTKVYIDGQAGTTGLQIYERIGMREDLTLLRIDEDKRHDLDERKKFLNNRGGLPDRESGSARDRCVHCSSNF